MSYITENCVYSHLCIEKDCACRLWGAEYDQATYDRMKKAYDAEIAEYERYMAEEEDDYTEELDDSDDDWKVVKTYAVVYSDGTIQTQETSLYALDWDDVVDYCEVEKE